MFTTERLLIRKFQPEDWQDLYEYLSQPEVVRFEPYDVFTEESCRHEAVIRSKSDAFWAVCLKNGGKLIGNIYLEKQNYDTWELGYVFNMDYQGKGYAFEAASTMVDFVFKQKNAHRAAAMCNPLNQRSLKLLERLGFRREGHLRKNIWFKKDSDGNPVWSDTYEYGILASEWPAGSSQPTNEPFLISPITGETRQLATDYIYREWFGTDMLICGEIIDMTKVDGFILLDETGTGIAGLITYIFRDSYCEITSFNSERENQGIGTALLERVKTEAINRHCDKLQLLTTNDNINAIRFYQKRGFDLVGVNMGAIDRERAQKPEIPLIGENGIPLHHEIEFSMKLEH